MAARVAAERGTRLERLAGGPNGPATARNRGAALAPTAEVLLFVDADVVVHRDTVARFAAAFAADPALDAVFGSYDERPDAPGLISRYKNLVHHFVHQRGRRAASTFWSGCGAVRRDAFLAVGGFDTRFGKASIEDIDLGLRLSDAARRVELRADIQCTHLKRWTLGSWLRTDIFARAVPWTRLILRRGGTLPDDLNLGYRERASAALALLGTAALPPLAFGGTRGAALLALIVAVLGFAWLQRRLLRFFVARLGALRGLGALGLHWVYFVYSSVTFVLVNVQARLRPASAALDG